MKDLPEIFARWDIGEFFGDGKSHGRVTVEPNWELNLLEVGIEQNPNFPIPGNPINRVGPFRRFQSLFGPLTEIVEVPNIKSIQIDRSIDTDAASCTIVINNQWMDNNGTPEALAGQLGNPGYFTWNRGDSIEAQARWNHVANDWNNVLIPNALLRTYQGYGGYVDGVQMALADAIDGGFITITGTWIVDVVNVGTDGTVSLKCRDAAKLLMVQQLFPPLVPSSVGTLKYSRWIDTPTNTIWNPGLGLATNNQISWVPLTYGAAPFAASSTDFILGGTDVAVMGYHPSNVYNSNFDDFAVGWGWGTSNGAEVLDYWEAWVGSVGAQTAQDINKISILPWFGPYTVYISVNEGGVWQGDNIIPYTGADPNAAIHYLISAGISLGTTGDVPTIFELPRTYNAAAIRVTLRLPNVSYLQDGTFRSGLREVRAGISAFSAKPWAYSMARHPNNGYWVIDATGQQFFFGDARELTKNDAQGISNVVVGAVGHPTSPGFWTVESTGRVHAYGASQYFGDAEGVGAADFTDIAVTPTGNGYWLLRLSGGVYTYGDAQYLSGWFQGATSVGELPATSPTDFAAAAMVGHPTLMGYWIIDHFGRVGAFFGSDASSQAHFYGEVTPPYPSLAAPSGIECTADGGGYWIAWSNGQIHNYGNAINVGQNGGITTPTPWEHVWWDIVRTNTPLTGYEQGYWTLRADGRVGAFGANYFGAPGDAGSTIRSDGNYQDYVEIIFDLLAWSGFAFYEIIPIDTFLFGVIGNLESTGAWSEEPISEDVFDKKPVIDAITTIKEIAGYLFWVDEIGGAHFEPPNWWGPGNWFENGTRTSFIPEIDEIFHLTEYGAQFDDESMRSEIIISNSLPEAGNTTTITSRYIPPGQNTLRNMVRPAMWVNEVFSRAEEQAVMAELIGMHIWFSQRQGSVSCSANPCIQINDQVRIWERVSAESYIHYVRGMSTRHDLETGLYEMSLTTHWMGSDQQWVIRPPGSGSGTTQNDEVEISIALLNRLLDAQNATSEIVNAWEVA